MSNFAFDGGFRPSDASGALLDFVPDQFSFAPLLNATPGTISRGITELSGMDDGQPLDPVNGEVSNDGGANWFSESTFIAGQSFLRTLPVVAPAFGSTLAAPTAELAGVSATYSVTSRAANTIPNPFSLPAVTGAALLNPYQATAPIVGPDAGIVIVASVVSGVGSVEVSNDGGATFSPSVSMVVGQTLARFTATSSDAYSDPVTLVGDINGRQASLAITTLADPDSGLSIFDLRQDAYTPHEDWMPYILPWVSGCPEALAMQQLNETLTDFCLQTRLWQHLLPTIDLSAGVSVYSLDIPSETEVVMVERILLNGLDIGPRDDTSRLVVGGQSPSYVRHRDRIEIQPAPKPGVLSSMEVKLSLKPGVNLRSSPELFIQNWR